MGGNLRCNGALKILGAFDSKFRRHLIRPYHNQPENLNERDDPACLRPKLAPTERSTVIDPCTSNKSWQRMSSFSSSGEIVGRLVLRAFAEVDQ